MMDESLKKRAYLEGLKMKNSGWDAEIIYARLEKQGIPHELANKVVSDILLEHKKDITERATPFYITALIKVAIGVLAAITYAVSFPGQLMLPIGLILTGVILAVVTKRDI
jgi:hypothetical protein